MTKTRVIVLGIIGALLGSGLSLFIGDSIASNAELARAKAYYCGYARGMKFTADRAKIEIGPVPITGCERFDYLETAIK